jgi:formamidase
VVHVAPGRQFILETRDGLDSDLDFNSTAADLAAVNLNRCDPLTGPVYIDGAKRGDAIAVTVVDIAPDEFATTTIVPGFGFLRDVFPDAYIVHWELNRLEARSKDMPGIAVPMNAFIGTVGVRKVRPHRGERPDDVEVCQGGGRNGSPSQFAGYWTPVTLPT